MSTDFSSSCYDEIAMKDDLRKYRLWKAQCPMTGTIVSVRIVKWDRDRKVAHVVDPAGNPRTLPFAYFMLKAA